MKAFCQKCRSLLEVEDRYQGQKVTCGFCGNIIVCPGEAQLNEEVEAEPDESSSDFSSPDDYRLGAGFTPNDPKAFAREFWDEKERRDLANVRVGCWIAFIVISGSLIFLLAYVGLD